MSAETTIQQIGLKHSFSDLGKGVKIHYVEKGAPDGAPVVFVHGFPDSWNSFRPVLNEISPAFHSFAIDLRGFGDSSRPEGGYAQDDFARDIIAFLDEHNIPKATLVGHSMGSFIVQRVALLYPERVEKVVLIGSASKGKGNQVLGEALEIVNTLHDPIDKSFIVEFQSGTVKKNVSKEFFDTIISESFKAPVRVWKEALTGLTESDNRDQLNKIKQKTLLVWGAFDTIFAREEQDILLKEIPQATLTIYQKAGHSLNWEQPEALARDLEQFLNS